MMHERAGVCLGGIAGVTLLAACSHTPSPAICGQDRCVLSGRVTIEWIKEDGFIYRPHRTNPLVFVTSKGVRIQPGPMYTDGGSVPRIFWSIDGLSPWGLGPAYIVHDWLFFQHRCGSPEERAQFTFQDSVDILHEVGVALIRSKLVEESGDFLPAITWAVSTPFARRLWDKPAGTDCDKPADAAIARRGRSGAIVVDFEIPPPQN